MIDKKSKSKTPLKKGKEVPIETRAEAENNI